MKRAKSIIKENIDTNTKLLKESGKICEVSNIIVNCLRNGGKVFIFGNGGSAADAQHIAAEFVNKFKFDRGPLPAIALTTDTSVITSISNDSGYKYVFERQIRALGKEGDISIAITTSDISDGHSDNIREALCVSRKKGIITVGLVSERSNDIIPFLDYFIRVPSKETPRIQESHILIAHIICEIVEELMF